MFLKLYLADVINIINELNIFFFNLKRSDIINLHINYLWHLSHNVSIHFFFMCVCVPEKKNDQ